MADSDWSKLVKAAESGNLETCEALLDAGADVDSADVRGITAFQQAVNCSGVALVRYFAEVAGANVHAASTQGGSPLHIAVCRRVGADASQETAWVEILTYLLELDVYDVDEPSPQGWTPLYIATMQDRPAFVALLLQHGADVGAGCVLGERVAPIMFAKSKGVKKLLRKWLRADGCAYPLCDDDSTPANSRCSLCESIYYCSKECQRADWREWHKKECGVSYELGAGGCVLKLPPSKKQQPATQAEAQAPAEAAVLLETGGQRAVEKGSSHGAFAVLNDSYEADRKKKLAQSPSAAPPPASAPPPSAPPPMPPPATPSLLFSDALLLLGWDPRDNLPGPAGDPDEPGFGAACLEERVEEIVSGGRRGAGDGSLPLGWRLPENPPFPPPSNPL
ncbi:hypothetical protein TeGR_g7636 [Tetraparma gracilis]|uniref:MYND-type domain-containing protein n=1 Tax=Tetraparma gracilis TaxID=2962635 RepID=A0ABQ6N9M6_9STRA|nr:hypothetical protein TeGR_g7636 [Tetraparma gracilis]